MDSARADASARLSPRPARHRRPQSSGASQRDGPRRQQVYLLAHSGTLRFPPFEQGLPRISCGRALRDDPRTWQLQIGYVPQSIYIMDDTLRRNVPFGLPGADIDDSAVWRALRIAGLQGFVERLPHGLDTVLGERGVQISGGELQRIAIARALYPDPAVLAFDEATSSLDVRTETDVMTSIRDLQRSKTIIIVSHRQTTIAHCDRIYALDRGRLDGDDRAPERQGADGGIPNSRGRGERRGASARLP